TEHDGSLGACYRRLRVAGIFQRIAEHPSGKNVLSDADRSAQPAGPARGAIHPDADIALLHSIVAHCGEKRTLLGLEQTNMDVVVAALHADAGLRLKSAKEPVKGVSGIEPAERAAIELVELVAIDGVVEEVGEIV